MVFGHAGTHEQIEVLSRRIEQAPGEVTLYLKRAELYRQHALLPEAEADCEKFLDLGGNAAEGLLCLARIRLDRDHLAEAMILLNQVLENRALIPAFLLRAEANGRMKKPKAAADDYERAIQLFEAPYHAQPDVYVAQALARVDAKQIDEAIAGLERGMKRVGPVISLQQAALDIEREQGRWTAALRRVDGILTDAPRKEEWLALRGELLMELDRPEEAQAAFADALKAIDALPSSRRAVDAMVELRGRVEVGLFGVREALREQ
jgi:tetratricopeptide (TPR) repeat protein